RGARENRRGEDSFHSIPRTPPSLSTSVRGARPGHGLPRLVLSVAFPGRSEVAPQEVAQHKQAGRVLATAQVMGCGCEVRRALTVSARGITRGGFEQPLALLLQGEQERQVRTAAAAL